MTSVGDRCTRYPRSDAKRETAVNADERRLRAGQRPDRFGPAQLGVLKRGGTRIFTTLICGCETVPGRQGLDSVLGAPWRLQAGDSAQGSEQ